MCLRRLIHPSLREFADDVRDGKFVLPIGRRMPLRDAAEAHVLGEKGGIGKILLLSPNSLRLDFFTAFSCRQVQSCCDRGFVWFRPRLRLRSSLYEEFTHPCRNSIRSEPYGLPPKALPSS